jgi:hypothetical protein
MLAAMAYSCWCLVAVLFSRSVCEGKPPRKPGPPAVVSEQHHDQSPPLREIPPATQPQHHKREVPNKPLPPPKKRS